MPYQENHSVSRSNRWSLALARDVWLVRRGQLSSYLRSGLHWIHQTDIRVIAEHVIEGMLAIDKFQFVELHVLCCFLEIAFFLKNFFL